MIGDSHGTQRYLVHLPIHTVMELPGRGVGLCISLLVLFFGRNMIYFEGLWEGVAIWISGVDVAGLFVA